MSDMMCINKERKEPKAWSSIKEGDPQGPDNGYDSLVPRHKLKKEGDPQAWHDPSVREDDSHFLSPKREPPRWQQLWYELITIHV